MKLKEKRAYPVMDATGVRKTLHCEKCKRELIPGGMLIENGLREINFLYCSGCNKSLKFIRI